MSFLDSLSNNVVTKRIKPDGSGYTVAAGTTDVNSDIVDTAGYAAVRFITLYGAITSTAVTSQKVQQGADSGLSDAADLEGSKITVADTDDNKLAISDFIQPKERYLRVAFDRGTANAVIDGLIVELYQAKDKTPVTQDTTVIAAEVFASPAEGTA